MMDDFGKLTVDEFLDRVANRTPSPGGGSVAAAAGALAGALAGMVAAYSIPKVAHAAKHRRFEEIVVRLHRADEVLRALITRDAAAYQAMTAARPKRGVSLPNESYQQAVLAALAVPLETAAAVADVLATLDGFMIDANEHLLSDLGAAAVLADAAAHASRFMVRVNAPELADANLRTRLLSDIDAIVRRCDAALSSVESFVTDRLESEPWSGR